MRGDGVSRSLTPPRPPALRANISTFSPASSGAEPEVVGSGSGRGEMWIMVREPSAQKPGFCRHDSPFLLSPLSKCAPSRLPVSLSPSRSHVEIGFTAALSTRPGPLLPRYRIDQLKARLSRHRMGLFLPTRDRQTLDCCACAIRPLAGLGTCAANPRSELSGLNGYFSPRMFVMVQVRHTACRGTTVPGRAPTILTHNTGQKLPRR